MKYSRLKYRISGGADKNLSDEAKKSRMNTFEYVISILNKNNINYAIINGIDDFPNNLGRDIDLVVDKKVINDSINLLYDFFYDKDNYFMLVRKSGYGLYQATIIDNYDSRSFASVQFDFTYSDINWIIGVFNPMPNKKILSTACLKNGIRVSIWANYIKTIRPLIYFHKHSIYKKFKIYKEIIDGKFKADYIDILGKELFKEFEIQVNKGSDAIIDWSKNLKRKVFLYKLRKNPIISVYNIFLNIIRRIKIIYYSNTPVIGIVGPDGVGKSSTIKGVSDVLNKAGLDIIVKHWRPGLLPNPGSFLGKRDDIYTDEYLPNNKKSNFQFLRFLYYYFDFLLGHFIIDRYPPISEFNLVIYDRCSIDMIVDPLRYGFTNRFYARIIFKLTPKPDYLIWLYDNPVSIYNRKPELSVDEIKRQSNLLDHLFSKGYINEKVNCNSGIDTTIFKTSASIILFLKKHYSIKHEYSANT